MRILPTAVYLVTLWGGQLFRPPPTTGQAAIVAGPDSHAAVVDEDPEGRRDPGPLPVPFLAQAPLLCGGASAAMVERFWGVRGVYAQDFRALVREGEGGIRFSDLAEELLARGWQVEALRHDPARGAALLKAGLPIIALVESGPDRLHYVVLVDWAGEEVTFHDPSSAPSTVETLEHFLARWARSGFRGLLVWPSPEGLPSVRGGAVEGEGSPHGHSVNGDSTVVLSAEATSGDPGTPSPGELKPEDIQDRLRASRRAFDEGRYGAGASLAASVAEGNPENSEAWRLLAANRYLDRRPAAALSAWNRIGRPRVDLIRLEGISKVDHAGVLRRLGVRHQEVLTPEKLTLAERRTSLIPSVKLTRASYVPNEDGSVEVTLHLWESPVLWGEWTGASSILLEAFTQERIRLDVPGLFGEGEAIRFEGRWQAARPRVALSFAAPSSPLPGIVSVTGSWGRERYSVYRPSSNEPEVVRELSEEWRSVALGLTEWLRHDTRARFTLRLDRWSRQGRFFGVGASGFTLLDDALVGFRYGGTAWVPFGGGKAFHRVGLEARWRSTREPASRLRMEARSGIALAGPDAPRNLWPGAGVGIARPYLLRARPLLRGGGVRADGLGRGLWFGGIELFLQGTSIGLLRFEPAVFSDVGELWEGDRAEAFHLDAGALIRVAVPGFDGWLQLSAARGLNDGASAVTLSWATSWWPR